MVERAIQDPRQRHRDGRRAARQPHALMEPDDAFALVARAMGLRHERVEPEHQPHPEDHDRGEHTAAHAGRGDRRRSERSDHDGVDEPHAHPPDFCEDDRAGQLHEGPEL